MGGACLMMMLSWHADGSGSMKHEGRSNKSGKGKRRMMMMIDDGK